MLVYGPFAASVLVVQIALLVTAGGTPMTIYALGCGLALPLAALGFAWVTIGAAFPAPAGGKGRPHPPDRRRRSASRPS